MAEATRRQASEADFAFKVGELEEDELKVTAFNGTEALSELYQFHVDLCSTTRDVDLASVLGKPCRLKIATSKGLRYVNGIVRAFARTREGSSLTHYAAEVVPLHWLLTRRFKSRIYQQQNCSDMTVPGILKQVLTDAGLPDDSFRFALEKSYAEREFVVQYRESDFDFMSRWMEHEGIFYFFEQTAEGHKLVFGDSPVAHAANPEDAEFPYRDPNALVEDKEFVFAALDRQEIQTGAICLDDFNFRKPQLELQATVKADLYTNLEYSDYPGEYEDKGVGQTYAQVRLEEFQAGRHVSHFAATVRGLIPGYKFTLTDHPTAALNREYLVTRIAHRATQPESAQEEAGAGQRAKHETEIDAIPSDVPFRPARKTPKPVVHGSQTALVTGPSGEEIYTDDDGYGRIKVQFHWDRDGKQDENSSCWIRCSQGWAGGTYGMFFLPRVGQEVIVDFLEGNADRPIITGRVYNNDNMPPYALPDEKTKATIKGNSTKGGGAFNEIRFDDKKDSEQIFINAAKDLDYRVKQDHRETISRDKHVTVERDMKLKVTRDEHHVVTGNQNLKIGGTRSTSVMGESVAVKGNYSLDISGLAAESCKGNRAIEVAGVLSLKASAIILEATGAITLTCGNGVVAVAAAGVATGPVTAVGMGPGVVAPVPASGVAPPPVPAPPAVALPPMPPSDPDPAATGDPGKDAQYQAQPKPYDPLDHATLHDPEDTPEKKHWIGVRLFDDNGLPLAGERYFVTLPDGTKIARGTTNEKGEAEIKNIDPGNCQITFPELDGATWDAGPAPTGESGGGSSGGAASSAAAGVPSGAGAPSLPV